MKHWLVEILLLPHLSSPLLSLLLHLLPLTSPLQVIPFVLKPQIQEEGAVCWK